MTLIGYTMMCEKTGPKQLAGDVASPSKPASTSRSSATTTSRGWRRKATPRARGACSVRPLRFPGRPDPSAEPSPGRV